MSKIIFIDDDPISHYIVKWLAKGSNPAVEVIASYNPETELAILEKHALEADNLPDAILLDLYIPGFDTYYFITYFEKLSNLLAKKVKLYAVSSSIKPEDTNICERYPVLAGFLHKPLASDMRKVFAPNYA